MGLGNSFSQNNYNYTYFCSYLVHSSNYEVKNRLSDISRFNLPNHKLRCHGNYCIDNVIIM